MFVNCFIFGLFSFYLFRNVSFTDQNLLSGIMSIHFFSNSSVCQHCGKVPFELKSNFSLRISHSRFSRRSKQALQCTRFTTLQSSELVSLGIAGQMKQIYSLIKYPNNRNEIQCDIISSSNAFVTKQCSIQKSRALYIIQCKKINKLIACNSEFHVYTIIKY